MEAGKGAWDLETANGRELTRMGAKGAELFMGGSGSGSTGRTLHQASRWDGKGIAVHSPVSCRTGISRPVGTGGGARLTPGGSGKGELS
jgi:hypothetical protein